MLPLSKGHPSVLGVMFGRGVQGGQGRRGEWRGQAGMRGGEGGAVEGGVDIGIGWEAEGEGKLVFLGAE